jgi:hypothetical protein
MVTIAQNTASLLLNMLTLDNLVAAVESPLRHVRTRGRVSIPCTHPSAHFPQGLARAGCAIMGSSRGVYICVTCSAAFELVGLAPWLQRYCPGDTTARDALVPGRVGVVTCLRALGRVPAHKRTGDVVVDGPWEHELAACSVAIAQLLEWELKGCTLSLTWPVTALLFEASVSTGHDFGPSPLL